MQRLQVHLTRRIVNRRTHTQRVELYEGEKLLSLMTQNKRHVSGTYVLSKITERLISSNENAADFHITQCMHHLRRIRTLSFRQSQSHEASTATNAHRGRNEMVRYQ